MCDGGVKLDQYAAQNWSYGASPSLRILLPLGGVGRAHVFNCRIATGISQ